MADEEFRKLEDFIWNRYAFKSNYSMDYFSKIITYEPLFLKEDEHKIVLVYINGTQVYMIIYIKDFNSLSSFCYFKGNFGELLDNKINDFNIIDKFHNFVTL